MAHSAFADMVRRYAMFGVKVEPEIYEGRYFITSCDRQGVTRYTIRRQESDGSVMIFGELHGFTTRVGAEQWLIGQRR